MSLNKTELGDLPALINILSSPSKQKKPQLMALCVCLTFLCFVKCEMKFHVKAQKDPIWTFFCYQWIVFYREDIANMSVLDHLIFMMIWKKKLFRL